MKIQGLHPVARRPNFMEGLKVVDETEGVCEHFHSVAELLSKAERTRVKRR